MQNLLRRLEDFSQEKNMSYKKIAKAMGVGASTLSEFRSGNYRGDVEVLKAKVEDFLERHKRKMRRIDFSVDTENKKRIFFAIDMIKQYVASNVTEQLTTSAKVGYIFGRAGTGKTHAITEYLKQYKGRGILITAENGISVKGILKRLTKELRLDTTGDAETLKERIKDSIRFTETIIVIDEGEHLKANVIDIIRSIADQTGVGIVIVGTETLKSNVFSQKREYEYLYSRAVVNMTLKDLTIVDVEKIVKRFLRTEIEDYKEEELSKIIAYINTSVRGSARQLENLLTLTSKIAHENIDESNGKITIKYVKAALTMSSII